MTWYPVTALSSTAAVGSVLEVGANVGLNLRAIRRLLPEAELAAVEINDTAVAALRELGDVEVHAVSALDFEPRG